MHDENFPLATILTVWRVSCEDNTLGPHQLVCGALCMMVPERERSIEQSKENHSSGEKERSLDNYYNESAANVHEFDLKMYYLVRQNNFL